MIFENEGLSIFGSPNDKNAMLGKLNIRNNAYFVSERSGVGSNDNAGTDPDKPLADLETAYLKCTANRGDYIFVLDFWTATAAPLTINKADIHLIGMGSGNFDAGNDITTSDASTAAVAVGNSGYDFELAGFNLSSSGTSGVCLSLLEGYRLHIHHLTFGVNIAATTGISGNSFTHSTLHDCLFGTLLTGNSFYTFPNTSIIRNNRFMATGGVCISAPGGSNFLATIVEDNRFLVDDGANGDAITVIVGSSGNMICNNYTMNGMLSAGYAYNPYRDLAAANTSNHWGMNYRGNSLIEPVGA